MHWPDDEPSFGGFSDPGASAFDDPAGPEEGPRYEVGALLGRGGMGTVHAARDLRLGRDVALKELRPELAHEAGALARVAREAAITSRLEHPAIVTVHDVGVLEDGRPFYTMHLVRGRTLARAADEADGPWDRRALLRHVLSAAEAVAAAHDAGMVHRDLKPSNILIGAHGETQVIDWGLAGPTPAAAARWGDLPGGVAVGPAGSTAFVAPEQLRGDPPHPTHDVYSLGRTLAVVVGGDGDELSAELGAIVARATAPEPAARYPDAAAFAADLLRWFEGRRVQAHAYSRAELLRRTLRAWRLPLGVAALGVVAVGVAAGVGWVQTSRSLGRALETEAQAQTALAELRLEQAVEATLAGRRAEAEALAGEVLRHHDDPLARGVFAAFGRAERPILRATSEAPACDWAELQVGAGQWVCGRGDRLSAWRGDRRVWSRTLSTAGGALQHGRLVVWDTRTLLELDPETGETRADWSGGPDDWRPIVPPRRLWSRAGRLDAESLPPSGCAGRMQVGAVSERGALAALCADGTLVLGSVEAGPTVRVATEIHGNHVASALSWTPTGGLLVGSLRGRISLLDGDTGRLLASGDTALGAIRRIVPAPDGRTAAVVGTEGELAIWQLDAAAVVAELPSSPSVGVAFDTDGLVVHRADALQSWRLPRSGPALVHTAAGVAEVVAEAQGPRLVAVGGGGAVTLVDLTGAETERLAFGDQVVKAAAFRADELVVTGLGGDRLATRAASGWAPLPAARPLRRLEALADGSLVGLDLDQGFYRWPHIRSAPERLQTDRTFIDLERDGEALLLLAADGALLRLRGGAREDLEPAPGARAVAHRADVVWWVRGREVVQRGPDGERVFALAHSPLLDLAASPDGRLVAAGGLDGRVRVWARPDGRLLGLLPGHTERVVSLAFLPDGDLASGSWDGTVRTWRLAALEAPLDALAQPPAPGNRPATATGAKR